MSVALRPPVHPLSIVVAATRATSVEPPSSTTDGVGGVEPNPPEPQQHRAEYHVHRALPRHRHWPSVSSLKRPRRGLITAAPTGKGGGRRGGRRAGGAGRRTDSARRGRAGAGGWAGGWAHERDGAAGEVDDAAAGEVDHAAEEGAVVLRAQPAVRAPRPVDDERVDHAMKTHEYAAYAYGVGSAGDGAGDVVADADAYMNWCSRGSSSARRAPRPVGLPRARGRCRADEGASPPYASVYPDPPDARADARVEQFFRRMFSGSSPAPPTSSIPKPPASGR